MCNYIDPPEIPEPPEEFVDDWLSENRDDIVFDNLEKINVAWEKHLAEKRRENEESIAEARAENDNL